MHEKQIFAPLFSVILCCFLLLTLSACGKRQGTLQAPENYSGETFPQPYPNPAKDW